MSDEKTPLDLTLQLHAENQTRFRNLEEGQGRIWKVLVYLAVIGTSGLLSQVVSAVMAHGLP